MRGAELFAGCGGLALGMARAGVQHVLMAEFDHNAVATVLHNKDREIDHVQEWPMSLLDVRDIHWGAVDALDVISGGPPCQPFGIGGKKQGHTDVRDMWPEAIRAVAEARPRTFLFENVRNLAGPKFRSYLEWIAAHLCKPTLSRRSTESHARHLTRLLRASVPADYQVVWQVVNAADYGAAQIRHRVLIFGMRADLGITLKLMEPTHSRDRLLWDQYVTGEYWKRHGLRRRERSANRPDQLRVERLRLQRLPPSGKPWVTVRDVLRGLGEPSGKNNHIHQRGARVYPGHTGSVLDLPSKALKAGDHGVPGGENMMVRDNGSVRYFTIREAARLVGLPDDYEFPRSWSESMRQLGNAVPAPLGEAAAKWLVSRLPRRGGQRPPRRYAA